MIALRLCWPIFAFWYMWQGATYSLVSTQMNNRKFELENGARYGSRGQTTHTARSILECALLCVNEKSCTNFNFGYGHCTLLPVTTFCRSNTHGWTHGHHPTGKCQQEVFQLNLYDLLDGNGKYRN